MVFQKPCLDNGHQYACSTLTSAEKRKGHTRPPVHFTQQSNAFADIMLITVKLALQVIPVDAKLHH